MLNKITLIGTMVADPTSLFDPDGNEFVRIAIHIPNPPGAPRADWANYETLLHPELEAGNETYGVTCKDPALVERCLASLHQGDLVYIEGRLILTTVRYADGGIATLHQILASEVIPLQATLQES